MKKIFSLDLIEETAGSNSFAREITLVPGPEAPKLLRPESHPDLLSSAIGVLVADALSSIDPKEIHL